MLDEVVVVVALLAGGKCDVRVLEVICPSYLSHGVVVSVRT